MKVELKIPKDLDEFSIIVKNKKIRITMIATIPHLILKEERLIPIRNGGRDFLQLEVDEMYRSLKSRL